jgi:ABC-2 type transport system ATP-binding protein
LRAIQVSGLTKYYGKLLAVDHISFGVEEGEIFGFLGPNGAGKTTTIKMLNTLTRISSGSATVGGFDVSRHPGEVRKVIGVVPQEMTLDREMTGRENLVIQGRLYGIPRDKLSKKAEELLALVDLEEASVREVNRYSWGMQKRLELVMGLVHEPRVIFLDEPTLGLDAQTRSNIWEYVRKLSRDFRVTIFLTTHYLEEADELCNRIAIIDGGRLQAEGSPKELKNSVGGETVVLRLREPAENRGVEQLLSQLGSVVAVKVKGKVCEVTTSAWEEVAPKLVLELAKKGVEVEGMDVVKRSLNEVFLKHVVSDANEETEEDEARMVAREKRLRERR